MLDVQLYANVRTQSMGSGGGACLILSTVLVRCIDAIYGSGRLTCSFNLQGW